jgi:hypothetical protein
MPFPAIDPSIDTFFEPSRILLFGKPFPTLNYDPAPMRNRTVVPRDGSESGSQSEPESVSVSEFMPYAASGEGVSAGSGELPMPPGRVEQALRQVGNEGIFARIYGFSFEGHYYKMPRPLLFLVQGEGDGSPEEPGAGGVRPFNARFSGVADKDWQFGLDIRVWAVDRHDIAICLDPVVGTYDEVLLQTLTGRDESAARGWWTPGPNAGFRGGMFGPHQER